MDSDSWSDCFSSFSKRHQSSFQSLSGSADLFMGYEEIDGDDDIREEFSCPFCTDYYEILGLCCHIEEDHSMESDDGVCPVCYIRVEVDMVAHITLEHGNLFKVQRKKKSRKGESQSTLSFLRKELQEGNFQSLLEDSSCIVLSSNEAPDPLLSSFILRMADDTVASPSHSLADTSSAKKDKEENTLERNMQVQSSALSIKDKEEHARRSEFVHQMLLSTILDDTL